MNVQRSLKTAAAYLMMMLLAALLLLLPGMITAAEDRSRLPEGFVNTKPGYLQDLPDALRDSELAKSLFAEEHYHSADYAAIHEGELTLPHPGEYIRQLRDAGILPGTDTARILANAEGFPDGYTFGVNEKGQHYYSFPAEDSAVPEGEDEERLPDAAAPQTEPVSLFITVEPFTKTVVSASWSGEIAPQNRGELLERYVSYLGAGSPGEGWSDIEMSLPYTDVTGLYAPETQLYITAAENTAAGWNDSYSVAVMSLSPEAFAGLPGS